MNTQSLRKMMLRRLMNYGVIPQFFKGKYGIEVNGKKWG
jgi:hypothetical protein